MLSALLSALTSPHPDLNIKPDDFQQPLLGWRRPAPPNLKGHKDRHTHLAALLGFCTGSGALLAVFIFLRLPNYLSENSQTGLKAAFRLVAGIAFLNAILAFVGLPKMESRQAKRIQNPVTVFEEIRKLGSGFQLALKDRQVALAYAAGFAARAQVVTVS